MADVWYVGVDQVPESLAVLLDERDRARRRRILGAADRSRFLAAWVLTRLVLGERLGRDPGALSFDRTCAHCGDTTHGKPVLEGAGTGRLDFSLSHAEGLAAVAFSNRTVGLDIESTTAGEQLLAAALTERERTTCSDYADVVRVWTRKEAVLKATGKGLAVHPARIDVRDSTLLALPGELGRPEDYILQDVPLPGRYVGSLAVLGPEGPLSVHHGADLFDDLATVA